MREARALYDTAWNSRGRCSALVLVLLGAQNVPHDTDQDDLPEKTVRGAGHHDQAFKARQGPNEDGTGRGTVASVFCQQRMANTQPFPDGAALDEHNRASYVARRRPLRDKQLAGHFRASNTSGRPAHANSISQESHTRGTSMSLIGPNEFEEDRQHAASDGMPNLRSMLAEI